MPSIKTLPLPILDIAPGSVISGKYIIENILGRGGMGVVFRAQDIRLGRPVALKFLAPELTQDLRARERFMREARSASAIEHHNICNIHEIDEIEDGRVFIAMAYYDGESLKEAIKHSPLEPRKAIDIALQIAEGLSRAHQKGIVHRDIKPGNIMVTRDGVVKILDFGLAKLAGEARLTRTGSTLGTANYMSPEQAKGEGIDQRTDVWSLGVVLYEMISGNLPFKGQNDQAVLYSVLNREPAPARNLPYDVPADLERILGRALAKDPEKRYASGAELAEALKRLKSELISDIPVRLRKLIFGKSRKRLLIGVAGIAALAVILFAWIVTRPRLAFSERDKILLADVDNLTEEPVFDLALRTAIEKDLQQSSYARIFDKAQVMETLQWMRKSPSTRVDEEIGCDICRFAGIRALILPRILSVGEAYELQAILVDPVSRRYVDRIRVTALGREQVLLSAVDELARKVRSSVGESIDSIASADEPIAKATTSSWEALNYVVQAETKRIEGNIKEAVKYLELALEKDPQFVSARATLGLYFIEFSDKKEKKEEGKELLRQALLNAGDLPPREYLMIKAANRQYVDEDLEGALDEYSMLNNLYPDVWAAFNNSGIILRSLGRFDEAIVMFEKAAELASSCGLPLNNLRNTYLHYMKNPQAAEAIDRRLINLGPEVASFHHWLAYSIMAQGRFEDAIEAYRKTLELEPQHPWGLPNLAHILLASGVAAEAVPVYREVRELVRRGRIEGSFAWNSISLAMALSEAGEAEEAIEAATEGKKDLLEKLGNDPPDIQQMLILGQLEAISGRINEAKQCLADALKRGVNDVNAQVYLAELYVLIGNDQLAIDTLKQALDSGYSDYFYPLIRPAFQPIRNDPRFRALFNLKD